jgi:hypothetical protein
MRKKTFCALTMVIAVGLLGAPAMAQETVPFVFADFEGGGLQGDTFEDSGDVWLVEGDGVSGSNSSGFILPCCDGGGGTGGLIAIDWGTNESPLLDLSNANYLNLYMKFSENPGPGAAAGFKLQNDTWQSIADDGNDQAAEAAWSDLNDLIDPGTFVADEWFYVSVPFADLLDVSDNGGVWPADFSAVRMLDIWIWNNFDGAIDIQVDYITFTANPEDGMVAPAPEQDASLNLRGVAGASQCFDVTNAGTAGSGDFTWTFDDGSGAVTVDGLVDGQICFNPLTEADAGTYVASFDDGAKVGNTFTLILEVLPEGTAVPASTNWTLLITILAIALSAGTFFGRKAIRQ